MEEDYKHSAPGKIVSQKYADLLFQSPPEPPAGHPRMSPARRAKIFSPFAALRGYEEEIEAEANDHLRIPRKELSEEEKHRLNSQLLSLQKGVFVRIQYFSGISNAGTYETMEGRVEKIYHSIHQLEIASFSEEASIKKQFPKEGLSRKLLSFENIASLEIFSS